MLAALALLAAGCRGRQAQAGPTATATALALPTQVVSIPSTTPGPTNTSVSAPTFTPEPTETSVPPTATRRATTEARPTATEEEALALTADVGANVRSGPGTNYPVIGGLNQGESAAVVGRDVSGTWFVIEWEAARNGQGWIADLVATFEGDVQELPVITAPPPPPATATPRAAANPPPAPAGRRGISGRLTLCSNKLTYAVGERVCFIESIRNTTSAPVSYGILGVQATNLSGGPSRFQTSWNGQEAPGGVLGIDPGCEGPTDRCNGPWEDGVSLSAPGTYRLTLQMCFSEFNACLGGGEWEVVSAPIDIVVQ